MPFININIMKKFQRIYFFLAMLILSNNIAYATISLGFAEPVQVGNSINIDINISGLGSGSLPSLGSYDLDILFDDSHLSFSNAMFGDPILGNQLDIFVFAANPSDAYLSEVGTINIYEISFDEIADLNDFQVDSFTLATLVFDVLKEDSSQIDFIINELGDAEANLLTANSVSNVVTTVPVPTTFWLLASALTVLYRKRIIKT